MRLGGEPDVGVEQAVEGFRSAGEFDEVAFERFGERIEQAPHVACGELLIAWLTPFVEDQRDVPIGAYADIQRTHHEVVGGAIIEVGELVAGDAAVLVVPAIHQFAHGTLHELWQVT